MNLSPFWQRARRPALPAFHFPLQGTVRIAAIDVAFREGPNLRHFSLADIVELRAWAPDALVLALEEALTLADGALQGRAGVPVPSTAIVILTRFDDPPLDAHHRDRLWRAFGVPVFEQLRAWDGRVVARECEVHDGLHIDEAVGAFRVEEGELIATQQSPQRTGLCGELTTAHCECGAETPRLRNLARVEAKASSAAA